jgi:RNA polymerase sigma-70 factor, ECF subfamily
MQHPFDDDLLMRLSELARTRRTALAALARSEGVTPEDAIDCVQEAFCTFLGMARRGEITEEEWLGSTLGVMVRNAARNRRRRHDRSHAHEDLSEHTLPTHDTAADEVLTREEDHRRLHLCVAELCAVQRSVVTLRMLDEQPGEDVARSLGISPGHVAVLLHRAKRALRTCMSEPVR